MFIYHIYFIHSSVDGHLGWFCFLALVTNAAVSMGVQVSLWGSVFIFFPVFISAGYIPRGVIAESYGNFIFIYFLFMVLGIKSGTMRMLGKYSTIELSAALFLNFLRTFFIVFDISSLLSSPAHHAHEFQDICYFLFLIVVILMNGRWFYDFDLYFADEYWYSHKFLVIHGWLVPGPSSNATIHGRSRSLCKIGSINI